jgi:DGQHR domain-containing protein
LALEPNSRQKNLFNFEQQIFNAIIEMTLPELIQRIEAAPNSTKEDLRVGVFLFNLGLSFKTANKKIKDKSQKDIGEIDLIFIDEEEDILFLIEVSNQTDKTSQKINHFFSKWANETNIQSLKKQFAITQKRVYKLNFDIVHRKGESSASLNHVLEDASNKMISIEDLKYFEGTFNAIGKWARNDLYSYLDIKPRSIHEDIPAIAFYIGNQRAFVYADHVSNILKYSYVYRRRKNDIGYQRMVQQGRVGSISKAIRKSTTLTFPNSIILNSNCILTSEKFTKEQCPASLKMKIPKTFCNFRIIDGQHRLLGFSKIGDFKRSEFLLPVVIFENLEQSKEVQTFIEINHKQKKLDSNLILTLKKDFDWKPSDEEYFEKISVLIAQKLNRNSELRQNIFFGYADEKKGKKITVATLHSVIKKNNLIGINTHLFQKNPSDIETPYLKIREVFSFIGIYFKQGKSFFFTNKGLRILFRILQMFEKNKQNDNIGLPMEELIKDLSKLFKTINFLKALEKFYGEGGARAATEKIINSLKRRTKYKSFETDLRKIGI